MDGSLSVLDMLKHFKTGLVRIMESNQSVLHLEPCVGLSGPLSVLAGPQRE